MQVKSIKINMKTTVKIINLINESIHPLKIYSLTKMGVDI